MYELKKKGIHGIFFILIFAGIVFGFIVFVNGGLKYNSPNKTTTTTQSINQNGESVQPGGTNQPTPNGNTNNGTTNSETTPNPVINGTTSSVTPQNSNTNNGTTNFITTSSVVINGTTKRTSSTRRPKTTTTTKKTTLNPSTVILGTRKVTNLIDQQTKYGVLIKTYETIYYTMYGDGRETEADRTREIKYDHSGYNATASDLIGEARTLVGVNNSIYNEVLNIVNRYRREAGVPAVTLDNSLSQSATVRALEMGYANYYNENHIRPNGTMPDTVLRELNISFKTLAENIGMGQRSASQVCTAWFDSPKHKVQMLDPNYTKLGVGYFSFNNNTYWVQHFTD